METPQARPRFGFWHGVIGTIALVIIVLLLVFPMFFHAHELSQRARPDWVIPSQTMSAEVKMKRTSVGAADEAQTASWTGSIVLAASRMLIKTADLAIEVKDAKKTLSGVTEIASKAGGFVTGSGLSGEEGTQSGTVTIRIPAANYASVLEQVSKLGKVLSKQEKGEDVTEEYVDLQSRIRNLKREEEAFLGVLRQAKRVPDILEVERELSRVRGEIEQAEGRAKYLQNQVALSTINVSFTEPTPVVTQAIQWDVVQTALGAIHALGGIFRALASLVIWVLVFIPLWLLIGLAIRGSKRLRRRRSQ